ncbi:MAG: hypothetical protein ACK5F0_11370, partial [Flavobacteriales bacterium]
MALKWKSLVPNFLNYIFRSIKLKKRQATLLNQQQSGQGFTQEELKQSLLSAGIQSGDHLMVHA